MVSNLNILITNDDGYTAKGIKILAEIMRRFGRVTVIAPKYYQSGMSAAVSMGCKALAYRLLRKDDEMSWAYLDATPASCVKFGLDEVLLDSRPDVVVCGINHGSNAATAVNYSGTMGAAEEAAINGILGIGVSIDTIDPDADFSAVESLFPGIFSKIMDNRPEKYGVYYNINFPDFDVSRIKGIRVGHQGFGHWEKEFKSWDPEAFRKRGLSREVLGIPADPKKEEGETLFMMAGDFKDGSPAEDRLADHHILADGCISVVAHNVDRCDYAESSRLEKLGFNKDF